MSSQGAEVATRAATAAPIRHSFSGEDELVVLPAVAASAVGGTGGGGGAAAAAAASSPVVAAVAASGEASNAASSGSSVGATEGMGRGGSGSAATDRAPVRNLLPLAVVLRRIARTFHDHVRRHAAEARQRRPGACQNV